MLGPPVPPPHWADAEEEIEHPYSLFRHELNGLRKILALGAARLQLGDPVRAWDSSVPALPLPCMHVLDGGCEKTIWSLGFPIDGLWGAGRALGRCTPFAVRACMLPANQLGCYRLMCYQESAQCMMPLPVWQAGAMKGL